MLLGHRKRLVTLWFKWNNVTERRIYERMVGVPDGVGLSFDGSVINTYNERRTLARFVRRADQVYFVDGRRTVASKGSALPPLVHVNLPNVLTTRRTRAIHAAVEGAGGQVAYIPQNVLNQADIRRSSMEVIATEKRPRPFRAPQQLVRARVAPRWGADRYAYFLSGYDLNEPGLSYFFCELPPYAEPTTLEEAYQALKPQSVKVAEAQGKKVRRQGDIFFIEMEKGFDIEPKHDPFRNRPAAWHHIHDTNHTAEYIAQEGPLTYVRGRIKHDPFGRRADHHTLHLGRRWWLAVKNTVPITGR